MWYRCVVDALLGRLQMYDKSGIHKFVHDEKTTTLHPMKGKPSKKVSMTNATKESLQAHHVHRATQKKKVRGQTLLQTRRMTQFVAHVWDKIV